MSENRKKTCKRKILQRHFWKTRKKLPQTSRLQKKR